jgi:uncharacterized protein YndB with AHSA1/START domain
MARIKTRTIRLQTFVHASPKKVFKAITQPERLARWMLDEATLSPRKGGRYAFTWEGGPTHTGTVLVSSSNPATISVHWALVKYTVKFEETGLPPGTNWTVTIDHQTDRLPHMSSYISFNIPNGTYPFTIAATGYTLASSPTSPITVDGASVIVAVTFT